MAEIDFTKQVYGRRKLVTNRRITGNAAADLKTVMKILSEVISIQNDNADAEMKLFNIFVNDRTWWDKNKETRNDINNVIRIPTAWALSRTLNGYCFGEPIKYIARGADTEGNVSKQAQVEKLSEMLDFCHNHDSDMMASMCASICGLGYKIALPANKEEIEETGIPFVINNDLIMPMLAGVVKTNETISRDVMGFVIGAYYDENGEKSGNQYTCWTNYAQYVFKDATDYSTEMPYAVVKQDFDGKKVDYVPLMNGKMPLVEVERNAFRKGDWEVAVSLLELRNNLLSNRIDDVQQMVDYILVLTNCAFENDEDKRNAINSRVLSLQTVDPNNPQKVEMLKNALDQTSIQQLADYIDLIIQECVGIPNRQERGGGGGDTGEAVKYRNGFRDLENNAGLIIPKMDKAELKFINLCLSYCKNINVEGIVDLKASDVRCKFLRSYNDDIISSSQAFLNYVNGGMDYVNALLWSKSGTDATEIANKIEKSFADGSNYLSLVQKLNATQNQSVNNNDNNSNAIGDENNNTGETTQQK